MIHHTQITDHILHLRQNGFEESANVFANLYAELKNTVSKLQTKEQAADFYSRAAGLKTIWGE
jgi:hypothetical protein